MDDEDEATDEARTSRRMPPFLSRHRRWGAWIPTRGSSPQALYHAETDYEISLTDLTSLDQVEARIAHVAEKSWCRDHDLVDLARALQELGIPRPS